MTRAKKRETTSYPHMRKVRLYFRLGVYSPRCPISSYNLSLSNRYGTWFDIGWIPGSTRTATSNFQQQEASQSQSWSTSWWKFQWLPRVLQRFDPRQNVSQPSLFDVVKHTTRAENGVKNTKTIKMQKYDIGLKKDYKITHYSPFSWFWSQII